MAFAKPEDYDDESLAETLRSNEETTLGGYEIMGEDYEYGEDEEEGEYGYEGEEGEEEEKKEKRHPPYRKDLGVEQGNVDTVIPSEGHIENIFQVQVRFKPNSLVEQGKKGYYIRVPFSEMIKPTWRGRTDELGVTDDSKVGKLSIRCEKTNYFHDISGRVSITNGRRKTIATRLGKESFVEDRLSADVRVPGSTRLMQFTFSKDNPGEGVCLRSTPKEEKKTFLEKIGKGHYGEEDLRKEVAPTPFDTTSETKLVHIDSAIAKKLKKLIPAEKINYHDTKKTNINIHPGDVDQIISTLLSEKMENLTVGEMIENGSIELCRTYADIHKIADSENDYDSPWAQPSEDTLAIREESLKKQQQEEELNREYFCNFAISAEIKNPKQNKGGK